MTTYEIRRVFQDDRPKQIIKTGLSLEDAQAHCSSDDTHGDDWMDMYVSVEYPQTKPKGLSLLAHTLHWENES